MGAQHTDDDDRAGRAGQAGPAARAWFALARFCLVVLLAALLAPASVRAQGLPTAVLLAFSHTQQATDATETVTRALSVPVGVGAPYYLVVSARNIADRQRIARLDISVGATQVFGAADLFRSFAIGGKRIDLPGANNTLTLAMQARAGVTVDVRVVGTPLPIKPVDLEPSPVAIQRGATAMLEAALSPVPTVAGAMVAASDRPLVAVPTLLLVPYAAGQRSIKIPVRALSAGNAVITLGGSGGLATANVRVITSAAAVSSLEPATLAIERGAASTLTVSLNSVRSSATTVQLNATPGGIVTVPASVSVPAGALSATVAVSTLAVGTAQVTATLGTSNAGAAVTVTGEAPVLTALLPPTSSVTLGGTAVLTAAISGAQAVPTAIALDAQPGGIVGVPASVSIPAGQTSAPFTVSTTALGTAMVRGTLNGATAEAAVSVTAPLPTIASLLPAQLDLTTGASGSFTLTLDAAQAGDTVVPLTNSAPARLQAPASVTVPAGRTAATFTVSALAAGSARLGASLNGSTRSADITISAPPPAVTAVEPASLSLVAGATGSATVRLNNVQPLATAVAIAAAPPGVLQVPASVTVAAGQTTAALPITALAAGTATLTATLPGGSASASVTVAAPPTQVTGLAPNLLTLAKGRTGTLRLAVSPAPGAPTVVTLATSSNAVDVPATITVPAGALGVDIPVATPAEGNATVTATLGGSSASADVVVTPPEVTTLAVTPIDGAAFIGETVQFSSTATLTDGSTRDETTRVTWASSASGVATIASTGAAQAQAAGSTTISATSTTSTGDVIATTPLTVLATPTLTLTPADASVAVGDSIGYTIATSAPAEAGGLAVNIGFGGSGAVGLPTSVTIAQGQSSAVFSVSGVSPGAVTLAATAPRRSPASAVLTVVSGVSITGIAPAGGGVGTVVTIGGSGFDAQAGANAVTFSGGAAATVTHAGATQLTVLVPAGAVSGPITVSNSRGSAQSPSFTVQSELDFNVAVSPASNTVLTGASTTLAVLPASTGTKPYTGLLDIAVSGLPAGVSATLQPATLNTQQTGSIVVNASAGATPGTYPITVQATGLTSAGRQTRSASATLVVQSASGTTGVKGRFVDPQGRPIAGVLVRVEANQTASDAAGNFVLLGLAPGENTLRFDATPAHPLYPIWPYNVNLEAGKVAVLSDWTINPPPPDESFVPIANAAQEQKITDARYPGFEVKLPAGAIIIGWDGVPKSRIAVERISPDKLPVPLPPVPIKESYQLYFGTPMGGIPSQPIPVTLPNVAEAEPGEKSEIWYFDGSPMGGSGEWKLAGLGTISADGKTVVSDPGVGIPRFCGVCGLVSQSCPPPPKPPQPPPTCPAPKGGNPVDYYTGQEMPTSAGLTCGGLVPIDTGMSYNPVDAFNGRAGTFASVGLGWTLDYDVVLLPFEGPQKRVVMPGGRFIDFVDDGAGVYRNTTSAAFDGAVMRPYPAGGANDWEVVFKSGRTWRFKPFPGIGGLIRGGPPLFVTEMIEPTGATLSITRRSDGRLLAAGTQHRAVTAAYGANGFINEIKDPENRTTRFTYTATNRIATVTDPAGGVTSYTYVDDTEIAPDAVCGPQGTMGERIKTIAYPGRPNPTQNVYGVGKRVLRQLGYDGVETRFSYKLAGACVTNIANPGVRCSGPTCPDTDSWDNHQAGWRLHGGTVIGTTMTRADGSTDSVRYGAGGAMLERRDGNAQATTYKRDTQGRVTAKTDALGRTTRYTLDDKGNVTRRIDALGRITDNTWDGRWNKPASITRYLADNTPVTVLMNYDSAAGNLTRVTNPLGQSTTYAYTGQGQLASVTDALGHKSELNYNAAGDLTALIDPLGNDTRLAYDAVGRAVSSTDPLGYSSALQYNALSQPTQSTDPLGGTTTNSYDTAQRLTAVTNARGKAIERYGWDAGDRLTSRTDALGRAETMTYDSQGRIATVTDRKGQLSRYRYDAEGRVVRIERADGDINLSYDAVGRLSRTDDAASSVSYEYDNADRIVKETQSSAAGSHTVQYEYDPLDRRTKRTVDGTEVTTYAWDRAGRLTSIGHAGQTTSYEYDAADRLTRRTLPNGIVQTMSYDDASRLTSIEYTQPGGTAIETIAYTYDANGQRTSKASSGNSSAQESAFTATYDDADRMTGVVLKGLGNAGADLSCTLAYDDNGNLSTKTCGAATTSYSWDSRNRLSTISGPGVNASFTYDVLGRRVSRAVNGETTTYVYDGVQAVGQTKGGVAASLLTGLQIDEVIATYAAPGNRTLLTDALGSVIAEAKDDRSIATRREYTSFGQVAASGEASANDSQYTARENDGTGLYYYRARYYDAQVKRFVQSDPIGLAGGINTYAYVGGNPLSYVDSFGLDATDWNNTSGGRSRWDGPTNGNWGGKCWSGGKYSCGPGNSPGNAPPVDSADACYQRHDNCYVACGSNKACIKRCDKLLLDELGKV